MALLRVREPPADDDKSVSKGEAELVSERDDCDGERVAGIDVERIPRTPLTHSQ